MKTLVVSATYQELKPLLGKAEKINQIDDKLNTYRLGSKEFDLCVPVLVWLQPLFIWVGC